MTLSKCECARFLGRKNGGYVGKYKIVARCILMIDIYRCV